MTKKHCCNSMTEKANSSILHHDRPSKGLDDLLIYFPNFDEYGIISFAVGISFNLVSFCPYCGTKLPISKRELWFDTLKKIGYDQPFEQDIPQEFKSDEWYNK